MEAKERRSGKHGEHGGGGLRGHGEEGRITFENTERTEHADSESRERGKKIVLRRLEEKTRLAYVLLVF